MLTFQASDDSTNNKKGPFIEEIKLFTGLAKIKRILLHQINFQPKFFLVTTFQKMISAKATKTDEMKLETKKQSET